MDIMYEEYQEQELTEADATVCPRCGKKTWYPEIGVCTTDEDYDRWNQ